MAEFILKSLLASRGMPQRFHIASGATSDEEIYRGVGNPIYPPARAEMERRGLPYDKNKRAYQICREDYDRYDLIVAMDNKNIRNMHLIFGGDPEGKIRRLLDYTDTPADVSDPWYSLEFDVAYDDIYRGCTALLDFILNN